jgi:hypothetical protein
MLYYLLHSQGEISQRRYVCLQHYNPFDNKVHTVSRSSWFRTYTIQQIEGGRSVEESLRIHALMTAHIHSKVLENSQKAAARTETYKNKNAKVVKFNVGDRVCSLLSSFSSIILVLNCD